MNISINQIKYIRLNGGSEILFNTGPEAQTCPCPVFVNKVLL